MGRRGVVASREEEGKIKYLHTERGNCVETSACMMEGGMSPTWKRVKSNRPRNDFDIEYCVRRLDEEIWREIEGGIVGLCRLVQCAFLLMPGTEGMSLLLVPRCP
jgi:hypothetical protein